MSVLCCVALLLELSIPAFAERPVVARGNCLGDGEPQLISNICTKSPRMFAAGLCNTNVGGAISHADNYSKRVAALAIANGICAPRGFLARTTSISPTCVMTFDCTKP